jgi:hypothetical protein
VNLATAARVIFIYLVLPEEQGKCPCVDGDKPTQQTEEVLRPALLVGKIEDVASCRVGRLDIEGGVSTLWS